MAVVPPTTSLAYLAISCDGAKGISSPSQRPDQQSASLHPNTDLSSPNDFLRRWLQSQVQLVITLNKQNGSTLGLWPKWAHLQVRGYLLAALSRIFKAIHILEACC